MYERARERIRKPRCFLLYTLAPSDLSASEANRILNAFTLRAYRGGAAEEGKKKVRSEK